jgi:hypothetical protein
VRELSDASFRLDEKIGEIGSKTYWHSLQVNERQVMDRAEVAVTNFDSCVLRKSP